MNITKTKEANQQRDARIMYKQYNDIVTLPLFFLMHAIGLLNNSELYFTIYKEASFNLKHLLKKLTVN
jgi:hypothetical protein